MFYDFLIWCDLFSSRKICYDAKKVFQTDFPLYKKVFILHLNFFLQQVLFDIKYPTNSQRELTVSQEIE